MRDQFKNMMIAIFVIAALSIIVLMMMFLHPNIGNEGRILRVRFADVDKITPGTRVNFGGKPIGEVLEVQEIKTEQGDRIEHAGIIYVYELILAIDSGVTIYTTDEITSRTSGLLGEKSVSITPLPARKGEKLIPVKGEILYAVETGSVESTLRELRNVSDKIGRALDEVIDAMAKMRDERVWENLGTTVENVADIVIAMNQPEKIQSIFDNADMVMQNLEETTTALNEPEKITATLDNLSATSSHFKEIIVRVQGGEGTLGSLLVKDDFYLRLSSLMSKGEVILNDINHYGLLFHLDKGWQRLRARRLNLLQTLSQPQEFRNFFNDELDRVTTALERVSMVLDQSTEGCCGWGLWQNPQYVKVYGELLRRVAMLEENLQMYNQQAMDCVVEQTEL
jgi:phospholipid/cholesterol/gamma-HCH transport system substrate-binding protein